MSKPYPNRPTLASGTEVFSEKSIDLQLQPSSLDYLNTKIIFEAGAKGVVVGPATNATKVVVEFVAYQEDGTEIRVWCPVEIKSLKTLPLEEPEDDST